MFADRLKLARKKAGFSMQELSLRIVPTVTAQAISKYENGQMMPSSAVLVGLAKALDVSLDFLMGGQVAELVGVEFRKHTGTSAKDRAQAEAIVIENLENYLAIEAILELAAVKDPFGDLRCEAEADLAHAEKMAVALRQQWNLGEDPIPSMTDLLEEQGIRVIEAALPERFHGLTCTVKRSGGKADTDVIVISSRSNVERKRFTLAHELAHRLMLEPADGTVPLEKVMNRFAGAFLAPANHLLREFGEGRHGITYHELMRLKKSYGMSAAAMLYRLADTGLLPRATVDYAFRTYAQGWRTQEPEPIGNGEGLGAFEKPSRFERLVYRACAEEMISPLRVAQLLKRSLAEVEAEIRGPRAA
jgi:Zn-dependent peptidase ImmA (M78 family)/DNA-binding XRE family transcriptional regulator